MKIIEITISPQGQIRIEAKGFAGSSCREATERLEQALGVRTSEQLTGEFYVQQSSATEIREVP
jgi:hypothetical protein